MSQVELISADVFETEVEHHAGPVLVDIFAAWCGPCKMIAPMLDILAVERPDLKIVKIDADHAQSVMIKYGVRSVPTLLLFDEGKVVATKVGALPMTALREFVAPVTA